LTLRFSRLSAALSPPYEPPTTRIRTASIIAVLVTAVELYVGYKLDGGAKLSLFIKVLKSLLVDSWLFGFRGRCELSRHIGQVGTPEVPAWYNSRYRR
jgi:hypothetical protein